MSTRTMTTYHRVRMTLNRPSEQRGPNCETLEIARRTNIPGAETAIVRTDWRLGNDGNWHETESVIVEWEVR